MRTLFAFVNIHSGAPGSPQWWQARPRGDHGRHRLPRANGITLDRIAEATLGIIQLDDRSTKRQAKDRKALQNRFRSLDPATYPTVHALGGELGGLQPDEEFEFGLHAIRDGIAGMRP